MEQYQALAIGGWPVRCFDRLDSTNRYLLELSAKDPIDRLVAVARHQTAGRGRRGRVWADEPGKSLLFSLLIHPQPGGGPVLPQGGGPGLHRYGQALALAVTDACSAVGGFSATLKWPNDVLVSGRKLAGILVETATTGRDTVVVAGCGLNLNWGGEVPPGFPAGEGSATRADHLPAVSADEVAGRTLDSEAMLTAVIKAFDVRVGHWDWIGDSYRARCSTIGSSVRVELPGESFSGVATDVDEEGHLLVTWENGDTRTLSSGDVVHLR